MAAATMLMMTSVAMEAGGANRETGVYRYDELIVLRKTRMAAVLLEAGSIINRDEELKMSSPERRDIISSGVAAAVKEFCEPRWAMLGPL